jgi:uncharacterized membrane protein YqjE
MEDSSPTLSEVAVTSKRIAHRLLTVSENRFELLMLELEEERDRLLQALWLTLGMAAFGVLAGFALTGLIVVLLWQYSPAGALAIVTAFYVGIAFLLYAKLKQLRQDWQTLPTTLSELRKDRECLAKNLS